MQEYIDNISKQEKKIGKADIIPEEQARLKEELSKAAIHEPNPKKGKHAVLPHVLQDLRDRAKVGINKYGTMLESDNGRDALMDAYQEALDLVMYLRQAIIERDNY